MIQRLLDALGRLAADPDAQAGRYAEWTARPDRLAPELADALLLMRSCQQESLGADQWDALDAVESYLDRECASADLWTKSALDSDPRWAELRRRARRALEALGRPGFSP